MFHFLRSLQWPRSKKRRVIFYRNFRMFTGGHLKIRDYYDHLRTSDRYDPFIYLTPSSRPDHLWRTNAKILTTYEPDKYDLIFVAGMDWQALAPFPGIETRIPVVNLIQGVKHASPDDPRHGFLGRQAVRLCVSKAVANSLNEAGSCNGPIHVVPLGIGSIDLPTIARPTSDVFIAGTKRPEIANKLADLLRQRGFQVSCLTSQVDRTRFLKHIAAARITVTLPLAEEGFFMPALEAMLCGRAVVCPDCVGNRDFCIDGVTAMMPPYEPHALADAVQRLLRDTQLEKQLIRSASEVASQHTLVRERRAFLDILDTIE